MAHFLVLSGSPGGLALASTPFTPFTEAAAGGPVSWGEQRRTEGTKGEEDGC